MLVTAIRLLQLMTVLTMSILCFCQPQTYDPDADCCSIGCTTTAPAVCMHLTKRTSTRSLTMTHRRTSCSDEPTFDLDPSELEKRYKQLQWQLHPDKAAQRPAAEREHSADHASLLNQAYSALRSPLARANYLVRDQIEVSECHK